MSNVLTRNQRLNELKHLLNGGNRLYHAASDRGGLGTSFPEILKNAEAWRAKAISTLSTIDATQKWFIWPDQQELSAISIDQAINGIQMLNWRIEDGRPEILSDEDADKINIATRLLAFGSYIINYATRNRRGIPFTDLNAFKPFQNEHLPMSLEKAQRWASQAKHKSDGWMKSLDFIKKHFDTGSNIFLLDKPLNWHFGWALFTLGWQLAESLGDSISMNDLRCCSFEQCKAARSEYNENRCITCPRCEGEVDYQQIPGDYLGETGPFSGLWYCEACSHTGYFPLNAHPDSVWHISKEQRTSAQQIVSIIANHPDPETESRLSISPNGSAELLALILVAVVTERKALLTELKEQNISLADDEIAGRYVDRFSLPGRKGAWQVVVGQSTEKGPHAAQAAVQDFVRSLNPTLVLLVGMCGGLPEHNANEKSVIVARQVLNYEPARIRNGHSIWSPTAYRGSPRITDLANALTARDTLPDINIITNKDYGSGEKLVDDLNSDIRANLLAHSGDLVGFEMEGQGMLHALWELQRNNPTVQASVLKGVSDFGDGQMRSKKEERQTSATRRAVRLGLEILRRY